MLKNISFENRGYLAQLNGTSVHEEYRHWTGNEGVFQSP